MGKRGKLSKEDQEEISKLRGLGLSQKELAIRFNVSQQAISDCLKKLKNSYIKKGVIIKDGKKI